jgi:hypothetical protein
MLYTLPLVMKPESKTELLAVNRLAQEVYKNRSNFENLCAALERLYEHFDPKKDERAE